MHKLSLRCLMLGHDDRIRRSSGHVYLECAECGRETRGWNLADGAATEARRAVSPRAASHGMRWMWSYMTRGRFDGAGLR
jgi:hypothetical protein